MNILSGFYQNLFWILTGGSCQGSSLYQKWTLSRKKTSQNPKLINPAKLRSESCSNSYLILLWRFFLDFSRILRYGCQFRIPFLGTRTHLTIGFCTLLNTLECLDIFFLSFWDKLLWVSGSQEREPTPGSGFFGMGTHSDLPQNEWKNTSKHSGVFKNARKRIVKWVLMPRNSESSVDSRS